MNPKIVFLKSDAPYMGTTVSFDQTQGQIQTLLEKRGCTRIATQRDLSGQYPVYQLLFEKQGIPYLIVFPVIYARSKKGDTLRMDVSARIIHDRVKALLIEADLGILDMSQAMAQFIALPAPDGSISNMESVIFDRRDQLQGGSFDLRYLLPSGKG